MKEKPDFKLAQVELRQVSMFNATSRFLTFPQPPSCLGIPAAFTANVSVCLLVCVS